MQTLLFVHQDSLVRYMTSYHYKGRYIVETDHSMVESLIYDVVIVKENCVIDGFVLPGYRLGNVEISLPEFLEKHKYLIFIRGTQYG